jgi:hypothetical protein
MSQEADKNRKEQIESGSRQDEKTRTDKVRKQTRTANQNR